VKYLSLFSGIEAASLAFDPLGWEPLAFAEMEPFPSAVLAARWPDVPNLGDVTAVDWEAWLAEHGRPDVVIAGSPCQAFSVAGNRRSLADARGNLTLFTAELVRLLQPRFFIWENVPGSLSTRDNAFGCLLGELVGAGEPLVPSGKRWTNSGLVSGLEARACWRILDAQYFGVAQRRRRLFLVLCPRDGADPAAVLLECESLFGDSAPRREARTRPAGGPPAGARGGDLLADSGVVRGLKARFGTSGSDLDDAEGGHRVPDGPWWDGSDVSECLDSSKLLKQQTMPEKGRFAAVVEPMAIPIQEPNCGTGPSGFDDQRKGLGVGDEDDPMYALQAGHQHAVAFREANSENSCGTAVSEDGSCPTLLNAAGNVVPAVAFKPSHYTRGKDGAPQETSPPLVAHMGRGLGDQDPHVLASGFHVKGGGGNDKRCSMVEDGSPAVVEPQPIGFQAKRGQNSDLCATQDGSPPLSVEGSVAAVVHPGAGGRADERMVLARETAPTLSGGHGGGAGHQYRQKGNEDALVASPDPAMAVRRLTPRECERLQGMEDDHTKIPWRGKPAEECPDGPRYKAIGNSMAVPVIRWIGRRVEYAAALHQD